MIGERERPIVEASMECPAVEGCLAGGVRHRIGILVVAFGAIAHGVLYRPGQAESDSSFGKIGFGTV